MINDNEIRIRVTDTTTYYVLGDDVRSDLLELTTALQQAPRPQNINKYDDDALYNMSTWLKEGRDFTEMQWVKFGKMLKKYNMPHTLKALAKQLDWTMGPQLTRNEMFGIMEHRRQEHTKQETKELLKQKFVGQAAELFDSIFETQQ